MVSQRIVSRREAHWEQFQLNTNRELERTLRVDITSFCDSYSLREDKQNSAAEWILEENWVLIWFRQVSQQVLRVLYTLSQRTGWRRRRRWVSRKVSPQVGHFWEYFGLGMYFGKKELVRNNFFRAKKKRHPKKSDICGTWDGLRWVCMSVLLHRTPGTLTLAKKFSADLLLLFSTRTRTACLCKFSAVSVYFSIKRTNLFDIVFYNVWLPTARLRFTGGW